MVPPLYWSDAFALGHSELDADHRSLIQGINAIVSAHSAGAEPAYLRQLLRDLGKSVKEHFDRENKVLREIVARAGANPTPAQQMSAAVLIEHIEEHRRTLRQLQLMTRAAQRNAEAAGKLLREELVSWFLEHAVKHDAHLKAVFQAM